MFHPIASAPIGDFPSDEGANVVASGFLGVTGASSGVLPVIGALTQTLSVSGLATSQGGAVEAGALLGFGPTGAGAIAEMFSTASPLISGVAVASGAISINGLSTSVLPIIGRAPDIILSPWSITPTNGGAVIGTAPAAPSDPAWNVSIGSPGFTIIQYPVYTSGVSSVPFLGITLFAQGGTIATATTAGLLSIDGESAGLNLATSSGAGAIDFTATSGGTVRVAGSIAQSFGISGSSVAVIGAVPVAASMTATFDIFGGSGGTAIISGAISQQIEFSLSSALVSETFGQALASIEFSLVSKMDRPSQRRVATARQSMNGGRVLSSQSPSTLEV